MTEYMTARFHDGQRFVCALVREGRLHLHLTMIDDCGIVHRTVDRSLVRSLRQLERKGKPYPVERMVKKFRAVARERGITEAAKAELAGALA